MLDNCMYSTIPIEQAMCHFHSEKLLWCFYELKVMLHFNDEQVKSHMIGLTP
jgi:hypothetical protein